MCVLLEGIQSMRIRPVPINMRRQSPETAGKGLTGGSYSGSGLPLAIARLI